MRRRAWFVLLSVLALVPIAIGVAGAGTGPVRLEAAKVIVEVNETDGDAGLQIFLDGDAWRQISVFRPDGQKIAEFATAGPVNDYGLTELFSESSEPPFTEFPLSQFKSLFPEGEYTFTGTTIDGQDVVGSATLTHDIPNGPNLVAPDDGARVDASNVVIRWREGRSPRRPDRRVPGRRDPRATAPGHGGRPSRKRSPADRAERVPRAERPLKVRGARDRGRWEPDADGAIVRGSLSSTERSEVDTAGEVRRHLRPCQLIDRDAVAARRPDRTARSVRDFEQALSFPSTALEDRERLVEVLDAVDEDRAFTFEVIREE